MLSASRAASLARSLPVLSPSLPQRSISFWKSFLSSFRKETRQAIINQPGLDQVRPPSPLRVLTQAGYYSAEDFGGTGEGQVDGEGLGSVGVSSKEQQGVRKFTHHVREGGGPSLCARVQRSGIISTPHPHLSLLAPHLY